MKSYLITVPVETKGTQTFEVQAQNEADAIARFDSGEADFVSEEMHTVSHRGKPKAELNE